MLDAATPLCMFNRRPHSPHPALPGVREYAGTDAPGSLVAPSHLCILWCDGMGSVCQTAVDDCLERVLGPGAEPASAFAVVFFEGHDQGGVQDALNSFAER